MIIELFGLPGCGKTHLINEIRGNSPLALVSENKIKRIVIYFAKLLSSFMPESVFLRKKLMDILSGQELHPIYLEKDCQKYIENLVMLCFGYKHAGSKTLFMDEGIIHRVVSLAVNYNLGVNSVFLLIECLKKYVCISKIFFLDVPIEECLKGIEERNRHSCLMDELKGSELKAFLLSYQKYFDAIQKKYNFLRITRNQYDELKKVVE